jgi:hypothetical protein
MRRKRNSTNWWASYHSGLTDLANRQPIGACCRQVPTCRVTVSEDRSSRFSVRTSHVQNSLAVSGKMS